MRPGLDRIPGEKDFKNAYELLQAKSSPVTLDLLVLYSQWARFDPRLAEIWVLHVVERWREIHPFKFHDRLMKSPWPAAVAPLLEFASRATSRNKEDSRIFKAWKEIITANVGGASNEQFFIGLRKMGGSAMFDDARFSLSQYKKWGYLSREILFNKQRLPHGHRGPRKGRSGSGTHSHDPQTRQELLKSLLERQSRISVRDYLDALGNSVSMRQAERDLLGSRLVLASGNTRARAYVRRGGKG